MRALTTAESARLEYLEDKVRAGLQTFVEVGTALAEIRDSRLYRDTHGTFEDYCRERWGMGRAKANRLIGAAEVVGHLAPMGATPENERQARPLTKLPPEEQREAWKEAVETAPTNGNGKPKVTAAHVERVVLERTKEEDDVQATGRRAGPRIALPAGMNAEEATRAAMAREAEGESTEQAAAALGLNPQTYRQMRYIVLLSDREDLNDRDRQTASDALDYLVVHETVTHPMDMVRPLVDRVYGAGAKKPPAMAEQSRLVAFDRAMGALTQACRMAAGVDVPHLAPDRARAVAAELRNAAQSVHELRHKIQEMA